MKLILTIKNGSLAGRVFSIEQGGISIGRGDDCGVRFDPHQEKVASKHHAVIEKKTDGFYLIDTNSTNGTFVNGGRVSSAKLNSGDVVQFGKGGIEAAILIEGQERFSPEQQNNAYSQPAPAFAGASPPPSQLSLRHSVSSLGLGHIDEKPAKAQTGKYVAIGLTLFATVFLSLIVMLLMVFSVGLIPAVLASFVAFIPAMFYLLPLIWLDRYDPEPLWLLGLAFAWGALVAVIVSFIINTAIGSVFGAIDPALGEFAGAVVSAPIFEEGSKGLGLILLLIFFRREFDDILDGIVYGGVIALGFATVENVLYYGRGIAGGGFAGVLILFVMRGILSPFAHVTFTAMTGIGCGIARESHNKFVKIMLPVIGYGVAVVLHAIWNGMAVLGGLGGFLVGYLVLQIPFFLIFVAFSLYVMRRQNKILKEMLAIDVARGLIPQDHFETATSAVKSTGWLLGSLFNGKFRARKQYLRSIGKLGLSYWHIQRATAAQGQTGSFQQNPILREEVLRWRDKV